MHGGNGPSKIIQHAVHLGKRGAARRINEALGACRLTSLQERCGPRGLDILEKREELGGAAPLDSDDVVISSGEKISANVQGRGVLSPQCGTIVAKLELGRRADHTSINSSTSDTNQELSQLMSHSQSRQTPLPYSIPRKSCTPIGVIAPPWHIPSRAHLGTSGIFECISLCVGVVPHAFEAFRDVVGILEELSG